MLRQLNYFQMRTHNPKRTETTPHSFRVNVCVFFLLVCAYLFFLLPCVCSCDYDFGDKVWRNYLATLKYILIWWFVLIADVWGADNVKKKNIYIRHMNSGRLWSSFAMYKNRLDKRNNVENDESRAFKMFAMCDASLDNMLRDCSDCRDRHLPW